MTNIIEKFGLITKEEELINITDAIIPNTEVFEADKPYPGYYDCFPKEIKPLYIYITTKKSYTSEEIIRFSQNIQEHFSCQFSIAWGTITIFNDKLNVIRILGLKNYGLIKILQEEYIKQGIELKKTLRKRTKANAIIKLNKLFQLNKVEEDLFFDINNQSHAYFYIPKQMTWEQFVSITKKVKYNWNQSMFDAAIGYFYTNFKLKSIVRIYNKNINPEYIKSIKGKYLSEINR